MEKVIVNPGDVRGLGNVVIPKSLSDYEGYCSVVSESSETVDNYNLPVYQLDYRAGSYLSFNSSKWITPESSSFSVSVTLKKVDNTAITSSTVKCSVNNGTAVSATTNSSGVATFNISTVENVCEYFLKFTYEGTSNIAGCFLTAKVVTGSDELSLDLTANKDIIQTNEHDALIATLTGTNCKSEAVGVAGISVHFFEEWYPNVRLRGTANIIQSGGTSVLTGQLFDTADGNIVKEAGQTINFYGDYQHFTDDCSGSTLSPFYHNSVRAGYTTYDNTNVLELGSYTLWGRVNIMLNPNVTGFTFECDILLYQSDSRFYITLLDGEGDPLYSPDVHVMGMTIGSSSDPLIRVPFIDNSNFYHLKFEVDGSNGKVTYNGVEATSSLFDLTDMRALDIYSRGYLKNIRFSEKR